jgi:hypothetical protein
MAFRKNANSTPVVTSFQVRCLMRYCAISAGLYSRLAETLLLTLTLSARTRDQQRITWDATATELLNHGTGLLNMAIYIAALRQNKAAELEKSTFILSLKPIFPISCFL